jgi:topoisomerase-4 subunit A
VIKIIREEDEPKVELMRYFELNDVQADAILNTRLRSLRKLEEMELKREFEALSLEKSEVEALLGSPDKQWKVVSAQIREVKKSFSQDTALGKRRSTFADAPDVGDIDLTEAMVEREPLTVVLSQNCSTVHHHLYKP